MRAVTVYARPRSPSIRLRTARANAMACASSAWHTALMVWGMPLTGMMSLPSRRMSSMGSKPSATITMPWLWSFIQSVSCSRVFENAV